MLINKLMTYKNCIKSAQVMSHGSHKNALPTSLPVAANLLLLSMRIHNHIHRVLAFSGMLPNNDCTGLLLQDTGLHRMTLARGLCIQLLLTVLQLCHSLRLSQWLHLPSTCSFTRVGLTLWFESFPCHSCSFPLSFTDISLH